MIYQYSFSNKFPRRYLFALIFENNVEDSAPHEGKKNKISLYSQNLSIVAGTQKNKIKQKTKTKQLPPPPRHMVWHK